MKEWFSTDELAEMGLTGLPATRRGLSSFAKRQSWKSRKTMDGVPLARRRKGRGGGFEYHYTVLPHSAQLKLVAAHRRARLQGADKGAAAPPEKGTGEPWEWFDRLPDKRKRVAEERLRALDAVIALHRGGLTKNAAVHLIARDMGKGARSLWGWFDLVAGRDRADWLPYLAPRHRGRTKTAECAPEAWEAFKAAFLREERPTLEACYDWVLEAASGQGWAVPCIKTLKRRLDREIPHACQVLLREGMDAAKRLYPAQERDRTGFHALEAVNADGHRADVWVTWPDGEVSRPWIIAIQDLYSNTILGWRVDKSPTATGVRLAFHDVFKSFGIPDLAYLDNGREFAAKMITGGQATRFRFKVSPEEMNGVLTQLGVEVHWTTPYSGQSKPIERAFKEFCDRIAKHPGLAGAYAGNCPDNKPSYKVAPADLATFLRVLENGVGRYNTRENRRTRVCAGRLSFRQAFDRSYASAPIKKAGPVQLKMAMLAAEQVTARKPAGTLHLFGNRYWAEFLTDHIGEKLTVRFDPDHLHGQVHVYRADGAFLGEAECWEAVGFANVDGAKDHNRQRREWLKAQRKIAEIERSMSIDDLAALLPDVDEAPAPEARTVRLVAGATALAADRLSEPDAAPDTGGVDLSAFSRGLRLIEGDRE